MVERDDVQHKASGKGRSRHTGRWQADDAAEVLLKLRKRVAQAVLRPHLPIGMGTISTRPHPVALRLWLRSSDHEHATPFNSLRDARSWNHFTDAVALRVGYHVQHLVICRWHVTSSS